MPDAGGDLINEALFGNGVTIPEVGLGPLPPARPADTTAGTLRPWKDGPG